MFKSRLNWDVISAQQWMSSMRGGGVAWVGVPSAHLSPGCVAGGSLLQCPSFSCQTPLTFLFAAPPPPDTLSLPLTTRFNPGDIFVGKTLTPLLRLCDSPKHFALCQASPLLSFMLGSLKPKPRPHLSFICLSHPPLSNNRLAQPIR